MLVPTHKAIFRNLSVVALLLTGLVGRPAPAAESGIEIDGKLAKWHRVSLTFDGPQTSERATPNPFTDYRLDVLFVGPSGQK